MNYIHILLQYHIFVNIKCDLFSTFFVDLLYNMNKIHYNSIYKIYKKGEHSCLKTS